MADSLFPIILAIVLLGLLGVSLILLLRPSMFLRHIKNPLQPDTPRNRVQMRGVGLFFDAQSPSQLLIVDSLPATIPQYARVTACLPGPASTRSSTPLTTHRVFVLLQGFDKRLSSSAAASNIALHCDPSSAVGFDH